MKAHVAEMSCNQLLVIPLLTVRTHIFAHNQITRWRDRGSRYGVELNERLTVIRLLLHIWLLDNIPINSPVHYDVEEADTKL